MGARGLLDEVDKSAGLVLMQELLLQTLQSFKELLAAAVDDEAAAQNGDANGADDAEEGPSADAAWRTFALASLSSFTRKYFLQLAPLAGSLQDEVFAEGAVAPPVREAMLLSLRL